jgi:hypothetical protein
LKGASNIGKKFAKAALACTLKGFCRGSGGHGRADADADRRDHEQSQHDVSLQAAECKSDVVTEH